MWERQPGSPPNSKKRTFSSKNLIGTLALILIRIREIYEVKVNESVPVNTPILRLKATDEDEGPNAKVSISIVAGNRDGHFRINPRTG